MSEAPAADFVGGPLGHRLRAGVGRGEPLARAVGLRSPRPPSGVVDATAGLGRDAAILAALGLAVTLIERVPALHEALAAGLVRAREAGGAAGAAAARMTLLAGDARDLLAGLAPEVVLVDPMHPERSGGALVKKPMRDVRAVAGGDPDAGELIAVALAAARRRVVLKWPRLAPLPAGCPAPHHTIETRTVRFDVFLRQVG